MGSLLLKSQPLLVWVLILPIIEASGFVYYLRSALSRPWLFAITNLVVIYFLLGFFVYRELVGIGISGAPGAHAAGVAESSLPIVVAGAAYLVLTLAAGWGVSYLFRRAL